MLNRGLQTRSSLIFSSNSMDWIGHHQRDNRDGPKHEQSGLQLIVSEHLYARFGIWEAPGIPRRQLRLACDGDNFLDPLDEVLVTYVKENSYIDFELDALIAVVDGSDGLTPTDIIPTASTTPSGADSKRYYKRCAPFSDGLIRYYRHSTKSLMAIPD
ncbi:hypothetical protein F5Y12DRAFT_719061 [Xylaria sp. FL1777]|nr:hypothetical protein F5Y12DRAFT_719061 [Xylaria sp. FL1777]